MNVAWSPQIPAVWRERLRRKHVGPGRVVGSMSAPPLVRHFRDRVAERLTFQGGLRLYGSKGSTAFCDESQQTQHQHSCSLAEEPQDNMPVHARYKEKEDMAQVMPGIESVTYGSAELQPFTYFSSSSPSCDGNTSAVEHETVLTWHCVKPPKYDGRNLFKRESVKGRRRKLSNSHVSLHGYIVSSQDDFLNRDPHFSVLRVCTHLLARDLCNWGAASRQYNAMTSTGFLWRRLLQQRLGTNFMSYATCVRFSARGWKHAYRSCIHAIDSMSHSAA